MIELTIFLVMVLLTLVWGIVLIITAVFAWPFIKAWFDHQRPTFKRPIERGCRVEDVRRSERLLTLWFDTGKDVIAILTASGLFVLMLVWVKFAMNVVGLTNISYTLTVIGAVVVWIAMFACVWMYWVRYWIWLYDKYVFFTNEIVHVKAKFIPLGLIFPQSKIETQSITPMTEVAEIFSATDVEDLPTSRIRTGSLYETLAQFRSKRVDTQSIALMSKAFQARDILEAMTHAWGVVIMIYVIRKKFKTLDTRISGYKASATKAEADMDDNQWSPDRAREVSDGMMSRIARLYPELELPPDPAYENNEILGQLVDCFSVEAPEPRVFDLITGAPVTITRVIRPRLSAIVS